MESFNIPVEDVADYFLDKLDAETEDCISNLKLQKLVYYAQGFVMALTGKKLFNEPIEAWAHGPVVRCLYDKFKKHKDKAILRPKNPCYTSLLKCSKKVREILDKVYQVYGQFSAWKLRDMTHQETPWNETNFNEVISDKLMLDFFKTQIA